MAQGSRDSITQTIAIDGIQVTEAELKSLGKEGEAAFQKLVAALQASHGSLGEFGDRVHGLSGGIEQLIQKFAALGGAMRPLLGVGGGEGSEFARGLGEAIEFLSTGLGGFVTLVGGAVAGFAALSSSAATATIETGNMARALGLTVERYEGLQFAASQVGVSQQAFGRTIERFAAAIGRAREETEKEEKAQLAAIPSLDAAANSRRGLQRAVDEASLAVDRSAQSMAGFGNTILGADLSLDHARENLKVLKAQLGSTLGLSIADRLKLRDAELRVSEASQRAADARKKQAEAIEQHRLAVEKLEEAQRKQNAASREALVKQNQLGQAQQDTTKQIMAAVAGFGQGLKSTDILTTLGQFADRWKAIEDPERRAALGMQAFGRRWVEMAPLLNLGSEGIKKLADEMERLKVTPTEEEEKFATKFYASIQKLGTVFEGLKNAIGNIISQALTPFFNDLAEGLAHAQEAFRTFAQAVVDLVVPPLKLISGVARGIYAAFEDIGKQLGEAFGGQAVANLSLAVGLFALFRSRLLLIVAAASAAYDVLEKVFGSKAADEIVAFVAVGAGLVRMFTQVRNALIAINVAAAPFYLLAAIIAGIAAAVFLLWGDTTGLSAAIGRVFGEDAQRAFDNFVESFRRAKDDFVATAKGTWQGLKDIWSAGTEALAALWDQYVTQPIVHAFDVLIYWATYFIGLVEKAIAKVGALLGMGGSGGAATGSTGDASFNPPAFGMAGGGLIDGPGTGTSDSVPLRASKGEFIERAAAVAYYGVDFMRRLNSMTLPRYAMGGLVGAGSIADAGAAAIGGIGGGALVQVDLTHFGSTFSGILAPHSVADALVSYSDGLRMRRGGKIPGFRGG